MGEVKKMEFTCTWPQLKAVQDRIAEIEKRTDFLVENHHGAFGPYKEEYNRLWEERRGLEDQEDEMRRAVRPEVGMPCTVCYYSDRSRARVSKILSKSHKTIEVEQCGLYSGKKVFTLRKGGHWVQKGTPSRDWGTVLLLAYEEDYFDMSF